MALRDHDRAARIVRQMKQADSVEALTEIYESIESNTLSENESRWVRIEWTIRLEALVAEFAERQHVWRDGKRPK